MTIQSQVEEFHRTFGHPIADRPTMPTTERARARLKWMREELDEFEEALEAGDFVKMYDAMLDESYFVAGTLVEMGLNLEIGIDIVHQANMAKVWPDGELHRDEDGKVLKPEGWVPPEARLELMIDLQEKAAELRFIAKSLAKRIHADELKLEEVTIPSGTTLEQAYYLQNLIVEGVEELHQADRAAADAERGRNVTDDLMAAFNRGVVQR